MGPVLLRLLRPIGRRLRPGGLRRGPQRGQLRVQRPALPGPHDDQDDQCQQQNGGQAEHRVAQHMPQAGRVDLDHRRLRRGRAGPRAVATRQRGIDAGRREQRGGRVRGAEPGPVFRPPLCRNTVLLVSAFSTCTGVSVGNCDLISAAMPATTALAALGCPELRVPGGPVGRDDVVPGRGQRHVGQVAGVRGLHDAWAERADRDDPGIGGRVVDRIRPGAAVTGRGNQDNALVQRLGDRGLLLRAPARGGATGRRAGRRRGVSAGPRGPRPVPVPVPVPPVPMAGGSAAGSIGSSMTLAPCRTA